MPPRTYLATGALIKAFEKTLPFCIRVSGTDNISDRPTLFVCNHFTRFETLLVPYVLYGTNRRQVRTLANHFLYKGWMARYLNACQVMSTRDPNRNDTIVGELMTGAINWVIYPEGGLVKTKKVVQGRRLHLDLPHRGGPPRTGAAVMAISAEVYKRRYLRALEKGEHERAQALAKRFGFTSAEDLVPDGTVITPVTITYSPIFNGRTIIVRLLERLKGSLNPKITEELRIETSLLLRPTEIGVHFGEAIEVRDYLDRPLENLRRITKRGRRIDDDPSLKSRARRLTERLMRGIYEDVEVNLEHLFCTALAAVQVGQISRIDLHAAIYLAGREIQRLDDVRMHPSLDADLQSLVTSSEPPRLARIIRLAQDERVLRVKDDQYIVDHERLTSEDVDFHVMRLERLTRIITNELEPLSRVVTLVRRAVEQAEHKRRAEVAMVLAEVDREAYDSAYERWHAPGVSRDREVGQPYLLNGRKSGVGVVLVHGYLACPPEMDVIARALHERGLNVYVARLEGHGTAPEHLEHVRWREWADSLRRAYGVMRHQCDHVIVGGFSLGGILALHLASEGDPSLAGVFTVNAPLKLRDRRAPLASTIVRWNRVAKWLRLTDRHATRPNHQSESPDINYLTNHLSGVVEIRRAIRSCQRRLERVTAPILVIQGDQDPVVDPMSAEVILESVGSVDREELRLHEERHVVVRGEVPPAMIERIAEFISRVEVEVGRSPRAARRGWAWGRRRRHETVVPESTES